MCLPGNRAAPRSVVPFSAPMRELVRQRKIDHGLVLAFMQPGTECVPGWQVKPLNDRWFGTKKTIGGEPEPEDSGESAEDIVADDREHIVHCLT